MLNDHRTDQCPAEDNIHNNQFLWVFQNTDIVKDIPYFTNKHPMMCHIPEVGTRNNKD